MGIETMMMAGLALSAVGTVASVANGISQSSAQAKANSQAEDNAKKQLKAAEEANNRANQKHPDTSALLSAAQQAGKSGASGTMLTGPQGVSASDLSLGKSTLLGA